MKHCVWNIKDDSSFKSLDIVFHLLENNLLKLIKTVSSEMIYNVIYTH